MINNNKHTILLRKPTTANERLFIEKLYVESFPPNERIDPSKLWNISDFNDKFTMYLIESDGIAIGLLSEWDLDGFRYLEHFAIDPQRRNGGIGQQVIEAILKNSPLPIVLEVEPSIDEMAKRRIGFYERCGMVISTIRYIQPPYSATTSAIELRLMSYNLKIDETNFQKIADEIYRNVYNTSFEYVMKNYHKTIQ